MQKKNKKKMIWRTRFSVSTNVVSIWNLSRLTDRVTSYQNTKQHCHISSCVSCIEPLTPLVIWSLPTHVVQINTLYHLKTNMSEGVLSK